MLLELARIFSSLYSNSRSTPRYNLVFVLSGAGKLNYQGSKKWLEDQLDGNEASVIQVFHESSLSTNISKFFTDKLSFTTLER